MKASRKQLQDLALTLFEQDIAAWPLTGLHAYIRDTATGFEWSGSAKTRNIKNKIERLLAAAECEPDQSESPTQH